MSVLDPSNLARYRDVARLLIRHGLLDRVGADRIGTGLSDGEEGAGGAEKLAADLEELGPTFVKLGQLLASRADLLPAEYVEALSRLQDDVAPLPFARIEAVVREELEIGIDAAFAEFDREPLAAASLGQVHRARLADGRVVAVKVQRPDIAGTIDDDLAVIQRLADLIDRHTDLGRRFAFGSMAAELSATLRRELDYRLEAGHLARLSDAFSSSRGLVVPAPVERLSTRRVLTMQFIEGATLSDPGVHRTNVDAEARAKELCVAYLEQMLLEGYFHADPHPGNLIVTPEGRLAIIDLGMVARLSPSFRKGLLRLVLAFSEGDGDAVADLCAGLGARLDDYDADRLRRRANRLAGRFRDARGGGESLGRLVFDLGRAAAESGIRPPAELAIVGKTLMHLDEVGRALAPGFDANAVIRSEMTAILARHMARSLHPKRAAAAAFEVGEFVQELPRRLNTALQALTDRELTVRVDAFDESRMMASLQRIGTRITLGILFAALIVGAALTVGIEGQASLFGYPVVSLLLLVPGLLGGLALIVSIVLKDLRRPGG